MSAMKRPHDSFRSRPPRLHNSPYVTTTPTLYHKRRPLFKCDYPQGGKNLREDPQHLRNHLAMLEIEIGSTVLVCEKGIRD